MVKLFMSRGYWAFLAWLCAGGMVFAVWEGSLIGAVVYLVLVVVSWFRWLWLGRQPVPDGQATIRLLGGPRDGDRIERAELSTWVAVVDVQATEARERSMVLHPSGGVPDHMVVYVTYRRGWFNGAEWVYVFESQGREGP